MLEEVLILGVELGQYWKDRDINSEDWDLDYSWETFRDKLDGSAYAFDTNRFETNFAYHPLAGALYHLAARNNRLGLLESLGFSVASSTVWEFIAEFRERVSVNDMFVTPLSGLVLGEATAQLGAFFDRSCDSAVNRALGSVFGPLKTMHDAVDGATLRRAERCDDLGFERLGAHRFRLALGAAEMRSASGSLFRTTRASVESSITNLASFGTEGSGWQTFDDGNLSELELGIAYAGAKLTDLQVAMRSVLAGAHYRQLKPGLGARALGHEVLFGVAVGADYSLHRYDLKDSLDRVFLVDAPAMLASFVGRRRGYGFELTLLAGGTLGGVDAFALPRYRQRAGTEGLTSIALSQRYNHVVGIALAPRIRLALEGAELGLTARSDRVIAIRALDRARKEASSVPASELRRRGSLWFSVGPPTGMRLTFSLEGSQRSGSVATTQRTATELGLGVGLGAAL